MRAELDRAVLQVPRANFLKPAGRPASGERHLTLDKERPTGIDRFRVDGERLGVAGRVTFEDGRPQTALFDRIRLGEATDASGELRIPRAPGDAWVASLRGRSLDASEEFGRDRVRPRAEDEAEPAGPPWSVEAKFDQVVLGGEGRVLMAVAGRADSDGRIIRRGVLTGQTGAGAAFRLEITPGRTGRTLVGTAEDAGGLLRALAVIEDMRGGRLVVQGSYDDRAAGHPLEGTAVIADFRMRNAPGLGKLLQAMTLYGLVDVLQGPGLGFDRLVAPFRLTRDTLELADMRAFSTSLGMTAKGRIETRPRHNGDRGHHRAGLFLQHAARRDSADREAVQPRARRRRVRRHLQHARPAARPGGVGQSAGGADAGVPARPVRHFRRAARRRPAGRGAGQRGAELKRTEPMATVKAILFDTFGTVVDWRGSLIAALSAFGKARGIDADWTALVDAWRGAYVPSMDRVRRGELPWTILDDLHRASLAGLVARFGIAGLSEADLDRITRFWHRLHPWPDAVPGLARLKAKFVIAPLSNGNVALLVNLAKFAGLPWDMVCSAELFGHYKPDPETYLGAAGLLGLAPGEVMMAAAHNADLHAARRCGLQTAFFPRPGEYGPLQDRDLAADSDWTVVARDIPDLAEQMGA